MQKTSIKCGIDHLGYCKLLQKLNSIESKCNRIILDLSEVKDLVSSKPSVDRLIESLEQSANDFIRAECQTARICRTKHGW